MPDTRVISNTSPLLYLHQTGYLDILKQLYSTIIVPPAVQAELEAGRRQGFDVPDVAALEWVQIHHVTSASLISIVTDLGAGEAEVIALGLNMTDSLLIIDDRLARRIAGLHNLRYTGPWVYL